MFFSVFIGVYEVTIFTITTIPYLQNDWQKLVTRLQQGSTPGDLEIEMENMPVLNMLNTRYVIYNPNAAPVLNPSFMDNAWFVEKVQVVENPDEEIAAIGKVDLTNTAVVDKRFADYVTDAPNTP